MKIAFSQSNFSTGEVSPRLYGQIDLPRYKNGLREATNAVCMPHGPIRRRNGSMYVAETKDSTKSTRLLRFQFSQTAAYILEFGHNYIRFYRARGQIASGGSPYTVTTTYTESELFEITYVQFGNTIFLSHYNHAPAQLQWTADASWVLSDLVFSPPATYENGYAPSATLTPGATSGTGVTFTAGSAVFLAGDVGRQLINLSGNGTATITGFTSTTVVTATITTTFPSTSAISSGNWKLDLSPIATLTPTGFQAGSSVTVYASSVGSTAHVKPGGTLTAGGTGTGTVTMTASASVFKAGDVGSRLVNLTGPGRGIITTYTSATAVDISIEEAFPNTVAIATQGWEMQGPGKIFRSANVGKYILMNDGVLKVLSVDASTQAATCVVLKSLSSLDSTIAWTMEEVSWSSTLGYPRVVSLHQQRLAFGSTANDPQTVWLSETALFESMGIGSGATDAISLDLSTREVNEVQWMVSLGSLAVGTTGSEVNITSGSSNIVLTPTTAAQQSQGYGGSKLQQPAVLDSEVLYVQRSQRKINSYRYDFSSDRYTSQDLLFLAEHLSAGLIREIAVASDPDRQIYAVLEDGSMLVCTYLRDEKVLAWSKFETDGLYESVNVISTGDRDEVWVVVNRTIGGSTKRYIEVFDSGDGTDNTDGFSDAYLVYSNPKAITAVTKAAEGVVTCTSHGFIAGNTIRIFDVEGMTELNGHTYTVSATNLTANTFKLEQSGAIVNTTGFTTYTSGGNAHKLVSTVSGLSHLEGKTVQVKTDGAAHSTKTVSSGAITLNSPAYEVTVGLLYESTITTLDLSYNLGMGMQTGQNVRWVKPLLRLYKSVLPTLNGSLKPAREASMLMDSSVPLYSGDVAYDSLDWDFTGRLTIATSQPFPLLLLGIFGTFDAGNR